MINTFYIWILYLFICGNFSVHNIFILFRMDAVVYLWTECKKCTSDTECAAQ